MCEHGRKESCHAPFFPFFLSVGENVNAMAGAPAAILSCEMNKRIETVHTKMTKQTSKRLWVLSTP